MVDIPEIPLENFEIPEQSDVSELGLKNEYEGSLDIAVIGVGQSGCRIAKSFYDKGYKKCLAINTAVGDLKPLELPENQKLKIGSSDGSGKSMVLGQKAVEDDSQKIYDNIRRVVGKVDKVILSYGCGGGTGSGSCLSMISLLMKYLQAEGHETPGLDIILIVALPTAGELNSPVIRRNTASILTTLSQLAEDNNRVGPIILMDNSKIEKLYKGIPPVKFWPTINDTIAGLFHTFNMVSKMESGYSTFDTEDYRKVLNVSGLAVLGVTRVQKGEHGLELSQALQDNIKKTLLCDKVSYGTAKQASCVVIADKAVLEETPMDVFNYGFDTISNLIPSADIHRGLLEGQTEGVRAFTLITGMRANEKLAIKDSLYNS